VNEFFLFDNTHVNELVDEELVTWDKAKKKINDNFIVVDAAAIWRLPLGRFWAWTEEKNGSFYVRSCHRLLARKNRESDGASSSGDGASLCWKRLWKMHVPPKVRGFWWRVIHNFVPCCQILKHRHMDQIANCKTCGAEEESIFHALFECTWAGQFWQEIKEATSFKLPVLHPLCQGRWTY
jgi:hypothetical protein